MQTQPTASEALTAAIEEVEAAATGATFSVPELRLASMRLALAASNYRNDVMRREVEASAVANKINAWTRCVRWLSWWVKQ